MPQFIDQRSVSWDDGERRVPLLRCECLERIDMDDLERGYCRSCMRTLEVVAGPSPVT